MTAALERDLTPDLLPDKPCECPHRRHHPGTTHRKPPLGVPATGRVVRDKEDTMHDDDNWDDNDWDPDITGDPMLDQTGYKSPRRSFHPVRWDAVARLAQQQREQQEERRRR